MSTIRASIVTFGLAAFAAATLAVTLPSSANALVTNKPPPADQSNCLQIKNRTGNLLKCGNTTYVLPSKIKRPD